jgi:hypothetical protein
MSTAYQTALDEFKDASAAVRVTFGAQAEARSAQIIANRNYTAATDAYLAATDRLARADDALMMAKDEAPAAADISPVTAVAGAAFVASPPPHPLFGTLFQDQFNGAGPDDAETQAD